MLQAYLPDSFDVLRELVAWARRSAAAGGAASRCASSKARTWRWNPSTPRRMVGSARRMPARPRPTPTTNECSTGRSTPERLSAVRIGVASHNLFDVAWARLLAEAAGRHRRASRSRCCKVWRPASTGPCGTATGHVRLYTPVVAAADFDSAARLPVPPARGEQPRRELPAQRRSICVQCRTFGLERSASRHPWRPLGGRLPVRRRSSLTRPLRDFRNVAGHRPDRCPFRARSVDTIDVPRFPRSRIKSRRTAGIDAVLTMAARTRLGWAAQAAGGSTRPAASGSPDELASRRPQLLAVMAHEAQQDAAEGDSEVSEAIDLAAYYAARFRDFAAIAIPKPPSRRRHRPGDAPVEFPARDPRRSVFAALAAGNCVVLKAPPQTPQLRFRGCRSRVGGMSSPAIPRALLQFVGCPEEVVGEHLVPTRR